MYYYCIAEKLKDSHAFYTNMLLFLTLQDIIKLDHTCMILTFLFSQIPLILAIAHAEH